MRTSLLLSALFLTATAALSAPGHADQNSCTVNAPDTTCTFHCHTAYWVYVSASGSGPVGAEGVCNAARALCRGFGACAVNSAQTAQQDDTGTCTRLFGATTATCFAHQQAP